MINYLCKIIKIKIKLSCHFAAFINHLFLITRPNKKKKSMTSSKFKKTLKKTSKINLKTSKRSWQISSKRSWRVSSKSNWQRPKSSWQISSKRSWQISKLRWTKKCQLLCLFNPAKYKTCSTLFKKKVRTNPPKFRMQEKLKMISIL